jgi:hypothetical protein
MVRWPGELVPPGTGPESRQIVGPSSAERSAFRLRLRAVAGSPCSTNRSPPARLAWRAHRSAAPASGLFSRRPSRQARNSGLASSRLSPSEVNTVPLATMSSKSSHFELRQFCRRSTSSGLTWKLKVKSLSAALEKRSAPQKSASIFLPSREKWKWPSALPSSPTWTSRNVLSALPGSSPLA